MQDELLAIWPDAPDYDVDPGGRWIRFRAPGGRMIYLQRYAWDDVSRPDFLVAWCQGDDPADQRRFGTFADAIEGVRALLDGRPAETVSGSRAA
jgi:hypothetical protein